MNCKTIYDHCIGAEGISLRNTRCVHIMEPYWHPVRIQQVIGRADVFVVTRVA